MKRRGKSSPEYRRLYCRVNPIRCNTKWNYTAARSVPKVWLDIIWRHIVQIDRFSRQNPAYRFSRIIYFFAGVFYGILSFFVFNTKVCIKTIQNPPRTRWVLYCMAVELMSSKCFLEIFMHIQLFLFYPG